MKTILENDLVILRVKTSLGTQIFCNITQLNEVVKEKSLHTGYFKITEMNISNEKVVSKKRLKELFVANNLKQEFFY